MSIITAIENQQLNEKISPFNIGDTIRVSFRIVEGKTARIQIFEGLVISLKNSSVRRTCIVRKISYGIGVERIFPLNSPRIEKIEVSRRGRVRRAKLYYIRDKIGKKATVKELVRRKR